jgi:formylglycine-generating enzyme required for sulfatase activity
MKTHWGFNRIIVGLATIFSLVLGLLGHAQITSKLLISSATKEHPWINSLGMKFVPVPGTRVLFSVWHTRLRDYRTYVQATGYTHYGDINVMKVIKKENGSYDLDWNETPKHASWQNVGFPQTPEHPVVGVSWQEAKSFCAWLTATERKTGKITAGYRYRLPTDHEWDVAIGKTNYPWGNQWPPPQNAGNYFDEAVVNQLPRQDWSHVPSNDGYAQTSPVGSYPPNRYGLYDMGGNVWQWCEDWYRSRMNSIKLRERWPLLKNDDGGKKLRVVRGASWRNYAPEILLSAARDYATPDCRYVNRGFRCVLAAESPHNSSD